MKSRFTEEEIVRIVQMSRAEGVTAAARQHSVSEQTLYNWRKRFVVTKGPMQTEELTRLQLENARLKRLVAERDLEIDLMQENTGRKARQGMQRPEAGSGTPWSETSRNTTFVNYCDELGVENKP